MSRESSSSRSKSPTSTIDDRTLLKFYQKKFEEQQRKEDKYKEKIDQHLKNLISDRHELEEEVLRRGEKISDLQKALVELQLSVFEERERFIKVSAENEELKRKEDQLHENMRQLLSMTQQKDLRDKIIYILKDPMVEIGYRKDFATKSKSVDSGLEVNKKFKEELEYMQNQLDEVLKISRNKSDVVLEDCKQALEKSKEKIVQDEILIRELQRKLHDLDAQEKKRTSKHAATAARSWSIDDQCDLNVQEKRRTSKHAATVARSWSIDDQCDQETRKSSKLMKPATKSWSADNRYDINTEDARKTVTSAKSGSRDNRYDLNLNSQEIRTSKNTIPVAKSWSIENEPSKHNIDSETSLTVSSHLKDIHLSLMLLLKIVFKINNILNSMQATKVYQRIANIPRAPSAMQDYVVDNTITQLETYLRQCTRLTFDINNMYKSLFKYIINHKRKIPSVNVLKSELKHLEELLKDLTVTTAETDLLNVGLHRSIFFLLLKGTATSTDEDVEQHVDDFQKIVSNSDLLTKTVSEAANFVESVIQMYCTISDHHLEVPEFVRGFSSASLESQREAFKGIPKRSASEPTTVKQKHCWVEQKTSEHKDSNIKESSSESSEDLEKLLGIYKRSLEEAEKYGLGLSAETKLLSEKLKATQKRLQKETESKKYDNYSEGSVRNISAGVPKPSNSSGLHSKLSKATQKRLQEEKLKKCDDYYKEDVMQEELFLSELMPEMSASDLRHSSSDDILRKIDKTLSKVKLMEQGEYFKDEHLCRKLAENVNDLTNKFKELTEEFNMKSVQEQFSEYYKLTLSKLEELAKQSRNSVVAAEAQIAAHRSNAKHLSEKLKGTEELLRESINECLSLKQKVKRAEEQREMDKYTFFSNLRQKLEKTRSQNELEEIIDELIHFAADDKRTEEVARPFLCVYCQQGMGHKLCEEKIRDLRAEDRKSKTMLKHLQQEMKEEKQTLKHYRELAEKASVEIAGQNSAMKETLQSLEKKNAVLLEQLKVEKNRVKNMERFRRLEIEGFQTDIKNLKTKIKDLEKQLLKAVLIFENNHKDMELLKAVHETAHHSKLATAAIRRLKAKLYELENDIKNL